MTSKDTCPNTQQLEQSQTIQQPALSDPRIFYRQGIGRALWETLRSILIGDISYTFLSSLERQPRSTTSVHYSQLLHEALGCLGLKARVCARVRLCCRLIYMASIHLFSVLDRVQVKQTRRGTAAGLPVSLQSRRRT